MGSKGLCGHLGLWPAMPWDEAHGLPHGHDSATPVSMGAFVVRVGLGLRVGLGSRVGPGSCMGLGSRVGDTRVDLLKKTQ